MVDTHFFAHSAKAKQKGIIYFTISLFTTKNNTEESTLPPQRPLIQMKIETKLPWTAITALTLIRNPPNRLIGDSWQASSPTTTRKLSDCKQSKNKQQSNETLAVDQKEQNEIAAQLQQAKQQEAIINLKTTATIHQPPTNMLCWSNDSNPLAPSHSARKYLST